VFHALTLVRYQCSAAIDQSGRPFNSRRDRVREAMAEVLQHVPRLHPSAVTFCRGHVCASVSCSKKMAPRRRKAATAFVLFLISYPAPWPHLSHSSEFPVMTRLWVPTANSCYERLDERSFECTGSSSLFSHRPSKIPRIVEHDIIDKVKEPGLQLNISYVIYRDGLRHNLVIY
jgi:hypothetical protein